MEAGLSEADGNDYEIQHNARLCDSSFRHILAGVNQDKAVAHRIPFLFKQPLDARPILTISDLRDEFEQFRIWADNIGVFASDHASLDYRLRDAFDVRHGVVSLLQSLYSGLIEVSSLLKEDRKYEDNDLSDGSQLDEEASSDSETELLTDSELTSLEIQNNLNHISDLITKLIHLAHTIRASGIQSRITKAAKYIHYEDGINQTEIFEKKYLPVVLRHRYQVTEPLLSRLCKVISSRRRQFMYQQKHQKRLAYNGGNLGDVDLSTNAPPNIDQSELNQKPTRTPTVPALPTVYHEAQSKIGAATIATTFRMNNLKRLAPSTMVASTAKFTMNSIDFPPPPSILDRATHFQCPYCCLLVEERKVEPGRWRKHVLHDLQPFLCIEPTCPDPYIILETWSDWVEHHRWTHAMEWWCEGIGPDHPPNRFTSAEEYSAHLLSGHMSVLSLRDVSRMVKGGGGPSQEPFKNCPFCDFQWHSPDFTLASDSLGALDTAKIRQTKLQSHIFGHLISMFMLALPEREDIEDSFTEGNQSGSPKGSVAASERSLLTPQL